ncbi:MAG: helix-turn-helix transcriptional regulator [Clostridia bacterium]|nr:helix-turn-helix transcriptional regulator [Clostridia bacterium]
MLKNNVEIDVKVKCIEENITQAKVAESIGTSPQYISRLIKHQDRIVNKTFISILESLGYDIELVYTKRPQEENEL